MLFHTLDKLHQLNEMCKTIPTSSTTHKTDIHTPTQTQTHIYYTLNIYSTPEIDAINRFPHRWTICPLRFPAEYVYVHAHRQPPYLVSFTLIHMPQPTIVTNAIPCECVCVCVSIIYGNLLNLFVQCTEATVQRTQSNGKKGGELIKCSINFIFYGNLSSNIHANVPCHIFETHYIIVAAVASYFPTMMMWRGGVYMQSLRGVRNNKNYPKWETKVRDAAWNQLTGWDHTPLTWFAIAFLHSSNTYYVHVDGYFFWTFSPNDSHNLVELCYLSSH